MLQSIRDHTQGWIAGSIISLLILSFALWGIHSYIGGGTSNLVVAKVNGTEITKNQLSVAYERLRRQLQSQLNAGSGLLPTQAEAGLKERALKTLVDIQILKQASYSENYRVSTQQVDGYIVNMPEFQVNGQFSEARFNQLLENTMYTPGEFLDLVQTSLLIDQPRLGLIFSSFALPDEVAHAMALINQERKFQYAILSQQALLKKPIQIAPEKIDAYYKQHIDQFNTPEQVSIDYVVLSLDELMKGQHPSDEALKKYYNENSNAYSQPMRWKFESILIPLTENASTKEVEQAQQKADQIFQKAKAGKDVKELLKEYSLTSANEKLSGMNSLNEISTELQKTVSNLNKVGQIADPVRTTQGIVILKLVDLKEPVAQPFEQVKEKVKESLIRQQNERKFADMREKLASISYEHPESLEPAAKALGLKVQTTGLFSKEKGTQDISSNPKVRETAFSNDVLIAQNNSDIIQTDNNNIVVIRIKSHMPATVQPLKSVEKQIVDILTAKEVEELLSKQATDIKQQLEAGATFEQITKKYNIVLKQIDFVARRVEKINSAILDAVFAMPKPQHDKLTFTTAKVPDGFAVIQLQAIKDGIEKQNPQQYQVFAQQIQNTQGLMEYELYKQSLINQAKVDIEIN